MVDKRLVYPGENVGVAEEFVPGPGTYEENGDIFSATIGYLTLDTTDFVARVQSIIPARPAVVKIGDIIIGTVGMTRTSMASVEVERIADLPNRGLGGDRNGTLHVSKTSEQYLESMESALRIRDIIRAKVIDTDPAIQLTTKGPHLGVLKSYCPRCGTIMVRAGKGVACPECEWKDTKKLADDFGEGNVL